jgi:hypothetical protein
VLEQGFPYFKPTVHGSSTPDRGFATSRSQA